LGKTGPERPVATVSYRAVSHPSGSVNKLGTGCGTAYFGLIAIANLLFIAAEAKGGTDGISDKT
jgi:hypothetical protein